MPRRRNTHSQETPWANCRSSRASRPSPRLALSNAIRKRRWWSARAPSTPAPRRKTVRAFTGQPVPRGVIENALRAAGAAPSGANRQPWHFAVVSDPDQNGRYGKAHKAEAREFYTHRRRRNERTRWHPWAPTPTSLS
ncbi:nitroreductase family protein [Chromobacterium violaceum]|uniref:nitroreductase family protein n=1 Tax=Chromobacterium violaceum TaxID=536 RepID=UPI001CE12912